MKDYQKGNIPLAKELRKNMTPWERKLWYEFLRSYPVRFQRQKALGNAIADFYCTQARLVVELDGGGHYEPHQSQRDQERTAALEAMGLRVLRICNRDVDRNFQGVCETIDAVVKESLPQAAARPAPSSKGAYSVTIAPPSEEQCSQFKKGAGRERKNHPKTSNIYCATGELTNAREPKNREGMNDLDRGDRNAKEAEVQPDQGESAGIHEA